jgi:Uma2 family endonuclease
METLLHAGIRLAEKPYKEIYDGQVHPKVSPQRDHFVVQGRVAAELVAWTGHRGFAGTELHVYLDERTILVPDVAFVSRDRFHGLSEEQNQKPPFAPDLVVEIRSPEDREKNIRRKTALHLAHGAIVVLDINPAKRTMRVTTRDAETTLHVGEVFSHPSFPGLALALDTIFASLDRRC